MRFSLPRASVYATFSLLLATGCTKPIRTPTEDQLRNQFAVELPAYWRAKSFHVDAAQQGGSEQSPTYQARFKAEVELTASTFTEARRIEDIVFIREAARAGETRTVYGKVDATWKDGAWRSALVMDNDPTRQLGHPRDFVRGGRVIVAGSGEEQAYWDEQRRREEEKAREEQARIDAEREQFFARVTGEWYGSAFKEKESRLYIVRERTWLSAVLLHEGHREELAVQVLPGDRLLLTGTSVVRENGRRANYNLDTFELQVTPDGTMLEGSARDEGGATGTLRMRKVGM